MQYSKFIFMPRFLPTVLAVFGTPFLLVLAASSEFFSGLLLIGSFICFLLTLVAVRDLLQTRHSILRNYPIIGHLRFLFEGVRPEMRQYFFEDDKTGRPFSRDDRAIVYQRAKAQLDQRPFGTEFDVYQEGFEFLAHSLSPVEETREKPRVKIGENRRQPYEASLFNISAMSFGALSANAIRALNSAAKRGSFAHDTGEGGISPYHKEHGGDLIWEIGTGYFGCRNSEGRFDAEKFAACAIDPQIKMIEIKLSQGAKPGHGGVLPGPKVSAEIAAIRGVPEGKDCISPPGHSAFSTPRELLEFVERLRGLSGGKPTGFKLCIGNRWEFLAICKAMLATGILPDFIVVDGKEGGTGAAPFEFMDHLGAPLRDGLNFVHNSLIGVGLREKIRLGAAGKIVSAFDIVRIMALGADWCNSARGFMFSLGCIQSLSCHTDACPTGIATQDRARQRALVVENKSERVLRFHSHTLKAVAELTAAAGLKHPGEFKPCHLSRRQGQGDVVTLETLYPTLADSALLTGCEDARFATAWKHATPDSFLPLH